jgi:ABC-type lipoprotein release transport system permease subunit
VASEVPFARVASRHDELDEIAGDPFGLWVDRILRWLFALSVAFAVVGAVSALAIAAADRRRDVGLLRTLGLTSRQAVTLTGIEQIPTVVVGTVAGAAAGIGITRLLDPALRVGVLAGGSSDAGVTIDVWAILVVGFVLVSLLAGSLVISVVAQRHTDSAKILRVGDD